MQLDQFGPSYIHSATNPGRSASGRTNPVILSIPNQNRPLPSPPRQQMFFTPTRNVQGINVDPNTYPVSLIIPNPRPVANTRASDPNSPPMNPVRQLPTRRDLLQRELQQQWAQQQRRDRNNNDPPNPNRSHRPTDL